jgi:hypothetical protein
MNISALSSAAAPLWGQQGRICGPPEGMAIVAVTAIKIVMAVVVMMAPPAEKWQLGHF